MSEDPAVGIDLGTTYSCVGVFRFGKVEVIANDQGNKITPSYVAFTENETFVGDPAKDQSMRNFKNTIFDVKRLIGRKFNDASVQGDIKQWPFEVVSDGTDNNNPRIKVEYGGKTKTYCPEEISSMVLRKLKSTAEAYLGKPVKKAVITVPAYFTDSQRQATIDAANIAGLEVLRLINEPTAAALAYGCDQNVHEPCTVLIFDLGGGTFDVSIVCIQDGVYEVKSTAGNTHLGGEDFDNRMVDYCAKEFKRIHHKDLTQNKKALRRLKTECERAKRTLSSAVTATIDICSLHENVDFYCTITRARFESLNMDLFQSAMNSVEKALQDAEIDKADINDIVLVGGSSRIPKIQKLLQDFFPIKELKKSINPEQAVAYGAAVKAAILNGDKSKEILDSVLIDVTPLSLGIEADKWCVNAGRVLKKQMDVVLHRNTAIPNRKTKAFTTAFDNQDFVDIEVYEGEYAVAKDNHFLGKFVLNKIPLGPEDEAKIDVTFDIDANGVLNVSAVEKSTGNKNEMTFSFNKGRLSKKEIEQLIHDAEEKNKNEDNRNYASIAKNALESYCFNMKQTIIDDELKSKIKKFDRELILKKCDETITWLHSNPPLETALFNNRQKELESVCDLIFAMAKDPDIKIHKFREILNVEKGASKEEIETAFRDIAVVRHPDKVKGDKDLGKWMWLTILTAKQALLCGSGATKRKFDAV